MSACASLVELYERTRVQDKQRRECFIIKCLFPACSFLCKLKKITLYELGYSQSHSYAFPFYSDYWEKLGMTNREGERGRGGRTGSSADGGGRYVFWLSAVFCLWQRTEVHTLTITYRHTCTCWTGLGGSHWCLAVSIRRVTQLFLQVCLQQLSPYGCG